MDCGRGAGGAKAGCCCSWLLLSNAVAGWCCWLLLLIAAVDCCYCYCWLLLLVAAAGCCCWLLLLVAAAGCCWLLLLVAAAGCCCWLLLLVLIAQKVFEYFRVVDDLRLRQICRRKSLWIFSGCCWFAAKTILQAKKSLNIFGLLKKSLWIFPEYGWEEDGREFRLGEVGSWR